jgi:plastocyanin
MKLSNRMIVSVVCAALGLISSVATAADFGDLKFTFMLDGKAPEPRKLDATKDPAVCAVKPLFDESISVGKDGGWKNVIGWLVPADGQKVAVNPALEAGLKMPVVLDNKNCRFEPHAALVTVGQELVLKNSDGVGHNTKADFQANKPVNPILPANSEQNIGALTKVEKRAVPISCSIHPWMTSNIVVMPTPYGGVSNEDGVLEIKGVPAGEYTFKFWHENVGYVAKMSKDGKPVEWKKGEVKIKVAAGANDQGTFKFAPKGK